MHSTLHDLHVWDNRAGCREPVPGMFACLWHVSLKSLSQWVSKAVIKVMRLFHLHEARAPEGVSWYKTVQAQDINVIKVLQQIPVSPLLDRKLLAAFQAHKIIYAKNTSVVLYMYICKHMWSLRSVCVSKTGISSHLSWQQLPFIPLYVLMWSHAPPCYPTAYIHIYSTLDIPEEWRIFTIAALILACWLSSADALEEVLLLALQASSTKRWQGYECLSRVHICIVILIIWFSSGCFCVPFYKSGYKTKTFTPAVPWARFSLLMILTDPLELIASVCCFLFQGSF